MSAALRARIGSLLLSSAARKIDFTLDGFRVDGDGFLYVAIALLSPTTGGRGINIRIGGVDAGFHAEYDPATNTLGFPNAGYGQTPFERMSIVHECVHVLRDARGRRLQSASGSFTTTALTDESAAYLAGALFHRFDAGADVPVWAVLAPIYNTAHHVAGKLVHQMGRPVPADDAQTLRDAVANNPAYEHLKKNPKYTYDNNGVRL